MPEMYLKKVHVTPEMAAEWLSTNPRNRSIKEFKVKQLEEAIRSGNWELTHQSIGIDENGKLVDGHHRLTAIKNTGIGVDMLVIFNAVESTKIDIGVSRNDRDSLYMSGIIDKNSVEYRCTTYPLVTFIALRSFGQGRSRTMTSDEKHILFKKLESDLTPVLNIINSHSAGKGRSSAIAYAMVCAFRAGVGIDDLDLWHKIVSTGDFYIEGNDKKTRAGKSVLLFKNWNDSTAAPGVIGSVKATGDEKVRKAESSIRHYVNGNCIAKLYGELVYPEIVVTEEDLLPDSLDKCV